MMETYTFDFNGVVMVGFGSISINNNMYNISSVYRNSIQAPVGEQNGSDNTKNTRADQRHDSGSQQTGKNDELSQADKRNIEQLKKTDTSVRSHELAHISAGGRFVKGGARFQYQTGPDGNRYAVAGEVSIDSSPIPGDPKATAEKMDKIRAAALAPSDPSNQDRRVANMASRVKAEAVMELSLLQVRNKMNSDPEKPESAFSTATASYKNSNDDNRIGSAIDLMM